MKKLFFDLMLNQMHSDHDIYLIFVGLGWPRLDEFKKEFPDRVINTEASEQTALDIAVGLAYSGKIPFVYSITPFLLYRGFETIRTYINHEKLNVKLVGAGRDDDYSKEDGYTHDASDVSKLFGKSRILDNIQDAYPTQEDLSIVLETMINHNKPYFLSLTR